MLKVTWCGVSQSPYNDFLLNSVNHKFDLQVYYKLRSINTHPWQLKSANYKQSSISSKLGNSLKRLFRSDIVVISGWSYWEHILIMALPIRAKKVYWTDTPNMSRQEWTGMKGGIRRLLVKFTFNRCDHVWSTGRPGCEALKQLGCPDQKISSFPFYLDLNRLKKAGTERFYAASAFRSKYAKAGSTVFMVMGQVARKKRFQDAILALSNQKGDETVLWIAGTGPEQSSLKDYAKSLNITSRVVFLGWLDQDDVELAYLASDVFVHPAEFDPFPTVVLDAMTWGKPVIGTLESGSVNDRIDSGSNGFAYNTGDVDALSRHMQFFTDNPGAITEFGAASRQTAEKFPVEIALNKLHSLV